MNETIIHRGPDDAGYFLDGKIGLGMRRLSIIDIDGGHQPVTNETSRIHVIQNGEIYNYRQLRLELEGRGHCFRTNSDTESIVHAYEEWGGFEFAKHLRGMFAIAVWDADRQELWLVRDRIGIKPLFYGNTPKGIAFASELKALLASPIISRDFDPSILGQYFTFGNAGTSGSFVKGVQQLRPAECLRYSNGRLKTQVYWQLPAPGSCSPITEHEAIEAIREKFSDTVQAHLVSDVSLGAFLSGGVDSSAVVGRMAQDNCGQLKTFSIGFADKKYDELPFALQVANRWGTDHYSEIVNPADAISILEELVKHLDEPFADASAIPMWYVAKLASQHVKVVLSGDGGDELFAGYTRYLDVRRDAWLDQVPIGIRKIGELIGGVLPHSFPGRYYLDYAARSLRERYVYSLALTPKPLCRQLIRPEWYGDYLDANCPTSESLAILEGLDGTDPISACMYLDMLQYLPSDILVKVDRMTMAHGLEARPPMLDHEFVEFVNSLPIELKLNKDGRQKHLFKESVRSFVPTELLDRKKAGFEVPLQSWFAGPLASLFQDCVMQNSRCGQYLDAQVIGQLFEENRRGRRDHGLKLWAVLMFEMWLRRILDASDSLCKVV